jgi:hypothetical protein
VEAYITRAGFAKGYKVLDTCGCRSSCDCDASYTFYETADDGTDAVSRKCERTYAETDVSCPPCARALCAERRAF